jgi:hypothetical protein
MEESRMDMVRGLCVWSLLAGVSLAGCGGGGSVGQQPLSKAQFVSRANAICVKGNTRIKALQKPTDVPGIATYMAAALPIAQEAQTKLDALVPPTSDHKRYARLLGIIAQSVSKISEVRSAAEAGDEQRVQRLSNDLAALEQRENGANEELGLKQCVSNGETED